MKNKPLVSVICLCYNHEKHVTDALNSVLRQTYENIQLLIVDDASTDNSIVVIEKIVAHHPNILFLKQNENTGNCTAFNNAFKHAHGDYIIDLAADDILLPERISEGIKAFQEHDDRYGLNFTNATYIDENGEITKSHYLYNTSGSLKQRIPQGDVFKEILSTHFICSPTTMLKKVVLDDLCGYDESLSYEDFDLWVRAARQWKFCYTDEILVQKRLLPQSHGQQQYKKGNNQMNSTYQVCLKAFKICKTKQEFAALRKRILYELKHAIWLLKLNLSIKYISLLLKTFA